MTKNKKNIIFSIIAIIIILGVLLGLYFFNLKKNMSSQTKERIEKINYDNLNINGKKDFIKNQLQKEPDIKTDKKTIIKQISDKKEKSKNNEEKLKALEEKILKQLEG